MIAYPARQAEVINLWGVAGGSIVAQAQVHPERFSEADALAFVTRVYRSEPPQPPLPPTAVDEILLIGSWLRQHRAAPNVLTLPTPQRPGEACPDAPQPTAADLAAAAQEMLQRLPLCGRALATGTRPSRRSSMRRLTSVSPQPFGGTGVCLPRGRSVLRDVRTAAGRRRTLAPARPAARRVQYDYRRTLNGGLKWATRTVRCRSVPQTTTPWCSTWTAS